MIQLPLIVDTDHSKKLAALPLADLILSPYNPRRTRSDDEVDALAQRILRNGYELTRAVWVYSTNGHYEVFAGGTRLEAARRAKLAEVPAILHEGFSDEEIVNLAEEDNENDEYHRPVSCVDTWLSYKMLRETLGWDLARIAKAKGCATSFVSMRLKLAAMPQAVLDQFFNRGGLNERHALELVKVSTVEDLGPWLTRESAMLEIINAVLAGDATKVTAATFARKVDAYNKAIELVQSAIAALPPEWAARLLGRLAARDARHLSTIRDEIGVIHAAIAEEKRRQEETARLAARQAKEARIEAERAERIATERDTWFAKNAVLYLGSIQDQGQHIADNSIDLIFTDPPYDENGIPLYEELAIFGARVLKPGGSLICYAGHYAIPEICQLMGSHLRYWWILCLEHSGGHARLPGKWVFVHWKPMLWFVKETRHNPEQRFVADLFASSPPDKDLHEWQQDISEAQYYIEQLTDPDGVICDPFVGTGTTLLAAIQLGRRGYGIDSNPEQIARTKERIDQYYVEELGRRGETAV